MSLRDEIIELINEHVAADTYRDLYGVEAAADAILSLLPPKGWRLVPEEATEAMGHAAAYFFAPEDQEDTGTVDMITAQAAWRAMLAAAPKPE